MKRISVSEARKILPDIVNKALYARETTILTRRGKGDVAAIIPMSLLHPVHSTGSSKASTRKKPAESISSQARRDATKIF